MGRTFENRKQAMAKRSDRDAKAFTRAGRQIAMAVKSGGSDPDGNPALRRAMANARSVNMPKDKVMAAIEKAAGSTDDSDYQEVIYEGYAPHGIALMVVSTTNNPTRTVANIRFAFKKGNGSLGNSGSVAFMFEQFGLFRIRPGEHDREDLEMELIDHGLEDMGDAEDDKGQPLWELRCSRDEFGTLQAGLDERKIEIESSGFVWVPNTKTELTDEQEEDVAKLIERLDADEDVQEVFHNLA